ncbi:MAG: molybdopterin-binding protein, partial [Halobacteria archaeon]|nr:molybdopterin-binding protein [Halobacteria archaeon]
SSKDKDEHEHKHEHEHEHEHEHDHGHGHHQKQKERKFAVLTVSSSRDEAEDTSGKAARELIEGDGHEVVNYSVVTDDTEEIRRKILDLLNSDTDAIVTTGGTGLTPDDVTVEAVRPILDKELP